MIFKPTLTLPSGKVKGNVDAELVLHTMIEFKNYDKALIVTGDGDFYCLVEHLIKKKKLLKLMIPDKKPLFFSISKINAPYSVYEQFRNQVGIQKKEKKEIKKKEALPRDGTLWMASHRDSIVIINTNTNFVNYSKPNRIRTYGLMIRSQTVCLV